MTWKRKIKVMKSDILKLDMTAMNGVDLRNLNILPYFYHNYSGHDAQLHPFSLISAF